MMQKPDRQGGCVNPSVSHSPRLPNIVNFAPSLTLGFLPRYAAIIVPVP